MTTPEAAYKPKELKARVSFSGTEFEIINDDSDDWYDCVLEIGPGVFSSDFSLRAGNIYTRYASGESHPYRFSAFEFTDSAGKRFNPLEYKPRELRIGCRATVEGEVGVLTYHTVALE